VGEGASHGVESVLAGSGPCHMTARRPGSRGYLTYARASVTVPVIAIFVGREGIAWLWSSMNGVRPLTWTSGCARASRSRLQDHLASRRSPAHHLAASGVARRTGAAGRVERQLGSRMPVEAVGDLGYTGVDAITIVPYRTSPGGTLDEGHKQFNVGLSRIRAAPPSSAPTPSTSKPGACYPRKAVGTALRPTNTVRC
jgi:hypothetical protein